MTPLGTFIRQRATQRGLTMTGLAQRAGKSRQTLLSLGTDTGSLPSIETLVSVAQALDVHPLRLLHLLFEDLPLPAKHQLAHQQRGDKSIFIADVTVPDGQVVSPGQRFVKTWAVQNVGTVPWVGRTLACADEDLVVTTANGAQLQVAQRLLPNTPRIAVPTTAPGETVELSVTFTAPRMPGGCVSYWKSYFADGRLCFPKALGLSCYVQVQSMKATDAAAG